MYDRKSVPGRDGGGEEGCDVDGTLLSLWNERSEMSGGVDDMADQAGDACNWDNSDATVEEELVGSESSEGDTGSFDGVASTCTTVPTLVLWMASGWSMASCHACDALSWSSNDRTPAGS